MILSRQDILKPSRHLTFFLTLSRRNKSAQGSNNFPKKLLPTSVCLENILLFLVYTVFRWAVRARKMTLALIKIAILLLLLHTMKHFGYLLRGACCKRWTTTTTSTGPRSFPQKDLFDAGVLTLKFCSSMDQWSSQDVSNKREDFPS